MSPVHRKRSRALPCVLALGGLEPLGRAGLLADVEAIRASGAAPAAVATAFTAQGTDTFRVDAVPPAALEAAIRAVGECAIPKAVKLGMVPDARALRVIARSVPAGTPWVVDPVVQSASGQRLSGLRREDYLGLAGADVVLTPNLVELAWLAAEDPPRALDGALRLAAGLVALGFGAVVVKGGHAPYGPIDLVARRSGVAFLRGVRLRRPESVRGTGCRFASALAAHLALGSTVESAALGARLYVRAHIRGASAR